MTLIIARIIWEEINIESDSKVTDESILTNNPLCWVIKTLILHPCISLSYAGNLFYAEKALERFFDEKITNNNVFLNMLLEINIESDNETDFILTSIIDNKPKIFKVSNWKVEKSWTFWIWDIEGFNLYQQEYHRLIWEDKGILESMHTAFKKVIDESKIESVGDYHITARTDSKLCPWTKVFAYIEKFEIHMWWTQNINTELTPLQLWEVTNGSYWISYFRTISADYHWVAIYYIHGNFWILFCPQINLNKWIKILDVSAKEFVDKIKDDYNIPLMGFIRNSSTSMQLYIWK